MSILNFFGKSAKAVELLEPEPVPAPTKLRIRS